MRMLMHVKFPIEPFNTLNKNDSADTANIELYVRVPITEPSGMKWTGMVVEAAGSIQ